MRRLALAAIFTLTIAAAYLPGVSRAKAVAPAVEAPTLTAAALDLAATRGAISGIAVRDAARWRKDLTRLYTRRSGEPLWFREATLTTSAQALIEAMRGADRFGLPSARYAAATVLYQALNFAGRRVLPDEIAALDVALSIEASRFVSHLHAGRISPRLAGHDLDVPHAALDLGTALEALAASNDLETVLRDFEPGFRHYDLLRGALLAYRELAQQPELNALPPLPARSVRTGEAYVGMTQLRTLLRALGDWPTEPETTDASAANTNFVDDRALDATTATALRRFQVRHGLDADGALGRATFAALTTPFLRRVQQIELALERTRWLPPKLDTPPIIVNIPQFRLFAFRTVEDDESDMLTMNVVVGKVFPETKTPVFAADMRYVVLRPYWDVPRSILLKELLPSIRADASWVARNGFEIVRGQSDDSPAVPASPESVEALARGELRLRQLPGARNALGDVKFMFPNKYNVYLHDTPARGLFAQAQRAASHGCIRVADPLGLADHVLRQVPGWDPVRIRETVDEARPTRVNLREPIRVFVLYATALALEDGRVLFFEDIYGHDAKLAKLLAAPR